MGVSAEKGRERLASNAASVVGLGAFLGLLLFAINGVVPLQELAPDTLNSLVPLGGNGAAATIVGVLGLAGMAPRRRGALGALAFVAAGLILCVAAAIGGGIREVGWVGCTLLGAGFALEALLWAKRLAAEGAEKARSIVLRAALVGSAVKLLLLAVHLWLLALVLAGLALASLVPLLASCGSHSGEEGALPGCTVPPAAVVVRRSGVLFLGLVLCLSVPAFTWQAGLLARPPAPFPSDAGVWGSAVGSLIAALVLWFMLERRRFGAGQLSSVAPLFCVFLLILAWIVGVWEQGLRLLGPVDGDLNMFVSNISVGFSLTALATLTVLVLLEGEPGAGTAGERGATKAAGLLVAATAVALLGLTVLQACLPLEGLASFELVLRLLYLVVASVFTIVGLQRSQGNARPLSEDDAVTRLAERFGLTEREAVVLGYVAEGRSAPAIAKAETVALSTVKTHMKHIYAKMGVHKREEILDLVRIERTGRA